jgi:hypothetical protein
MDQSQELYANVCRCHFQQEIVGARYDTFQKPRLMKGAGITSDIQNHFPMFPNEKILGQVGGHGVSFNGFRLFGWQPPKMLSSILTLGAYPWDIDQRLAVTTHRVLASAGALNSPLCCSCYFIPSYRYDTFGSVSQIQFLLLVDYFVALFYRIASQGRRECG